TARTTSTPISRRKAAAARPARPNPRAPAIAPGSETSNSPRHLARERHHLAPEKLDAAHHLLVRQRTGAVFHSEAREPERLHRRGDLARHRLRRADIERAVLDLLLEFRAPHRSPAAFGADAVAERLVVRPKLRPRRLVGLADVAGRMHADRQV